MTTLILSATVAILMVINASTFMKYLSVRHQLKKTKNELKIFRNIHNDVQRNLRDEMNKNLILQSLLNQKTKV